MSAPVLAERVKPARNPRLSETIFSARQRTDASVSLERESVYAFLDRVADPVFERVRRLIEAWFADFGPGRARGRRFSDFARG